MYLYSFIFFLSSSPVIPCFQNIFSKGLCLQELLKNIARPRKQSLGEFCYKVPLHVAVVLVGVK